MSPLRNQPCSLLELVAGLTSSVVPNLPIKNITADSRLVSPGTLFVAVPGSKADGTQYLETAFNSGAVAAIVSTGVSVSAAQESGKVLIRVASPRQALAILSARFHGEPAAQMNLCAVTGTNGKTTSAWLMQQALETIDAAPVLRLGTAGNYLRGVLDEQSNLTTLDPVGFHSYLATAVQHGATYGTLEASSHALEQDRLFGTPIRVALFTNLTRDHLDYHGTVEAYENSKQKLFDLVRPQDGVAVIHVDDPVGERYQRYCMNQGISVISFGRALSRLPIAQQSRHVTLLSNEMDALAGSVLRYRIQGEFRDASDGYEGELRSPLIGSFNAENVMGVFCALLALGISVNDATRGLATATGAPGRLERFIGEGKAVLVDYAHTPDALARALEAVRAICRGKLFALFGCGGDRDRGKRPIMGEIATRLADQVIVTSDNPRTEQPGTIIDDIIAGIPRDAFISGRVKTVEQRGAAIAEAIAVMERGDVLLVAGKGHEQYQIIGTETLPFSDQAEVRKALVKKALAQKEP